MYSDGDGFSPTGVVKYIVTVLIGIILISVFCSVVINMVYEEDIEKDNGVGLGVPMTNATSSTNAELLFSKTANGIEVSGTYNGLVTSSDIVLVLANNQSVYVSDGKLHYYNGFMDAILTELPISITDGKMNGTAYTWLYYPYSDGLYRAYDGSVDYEVNQRVAGIGASGGTVIISMNDTVSSNNSGEDVSVYIDRSEEGIDGIYYRWV